MSTTAQERLQAARSDLMNAEAVIVGEHMEQMKEQFAAAIAEGKTIDEQMEATGARLVEARAKAEPLWIKRDGISKARADLDAAFQQNDFAGDSETAEYERKRAALTDEWERLTTKEIIPLSNLIGQLDHEFTQLKFARGRVAGRVSDLRAAIADRRGKRV
jgi:hypothetical protein